jgi:hypothetical protein
VEVGTNVNSGPVVLLVVGAESDVAVDSVTGISGCTPGADEDGDAAGVPVLWVVGEVYEKVVEGVAVVLSELMVIGAAVLVLLVVGV